MSFGLLEGFEDSDNSTLEVLGDEAITSIDELKKAVKANTIDATLPQNDNLDIAHEGFDEFELSALEESAYFGVCKEDSKEEDLSSEDDDESKDSDDELEDFEDDDWCE
jgi:hypothetical protein